RQFRSSAPGRAPPETEQRHLRIRWIDPSSTQTFVPATFTPRVPRAASVVTRRSFASLPGHCAASRRAAREGVSADWPRSSGRVGIPCEFAQAHSLFARLPLCLGKAQKREDVIVRLIETLDDRGTTQPPRLRGGYGQVDIMSLGCT